MSETMRVGYDYTFNYFGKGTLTGKPVNGASVTLNIRAYKDGKEVLFEENDELAIPIHGSDENYYLDEAYNIYFDNDKLFVVIRNEPIYNMFIDAYGWDRIEAEVIGYSLDVVVGRTRDYLEGEDLPEEFLDAPMAEPVPVDKDTFLSFLELFKDDFDISDNKPAQVPSVVFYEPGMPTGREPVACS